MPIIIDPIIVGPTIPIITCPSVVPCTGDTNSFTFKFKVANGYDHLEKLSWTPTTLGVSLDSITETSTGFTANLVANKIYGFDTHTLTINVRWQGTDGMYINTKQDIVLAPNGEPEPSPTPEPTPVEPPAYTPNITYLPSDNVTVAGTEVNGRVDVVFDYIGPKSIELTVNSYSWVSAKLTLDSQVDRQIKGHIDYTCLKNTSTPNRGGSFTLRGKSIDGTQIARTFSITQRLYTPAKITISPAEVEVGGEGGTGEAQISGTSVTNVGVSADSWINYIVSGDTLTWTVGENEAVSSIGMPIDRTGYLTVSGTSTNDNSTTVEGKFKIYQRAKQPEPTEEIPSYTDIVCHFETDAVQWVDFKVAVDNQDIFAGRSYLLDGKTDIRVDNIIADYIKHNMDFYNPEGDTDYIFKDNKGIYKVDLKVGNEDTEYTIYQTWFVRYDWSYEQGTGAGAMILNRPIFNFVDENQSWYPVTWVRHFNGGNLPLEWWRDGDTSARHHIDYLPEDQQLGVDSEGFPILAPIIGTNLIRIQGLAGINYIMGYGGSIKRTKVRPATYDYCLYYRNPFGGIDYMLFNRASQKTINATSEQYTRKALRDSEDFELTEYLRSTQDTYTLKTPILTDEQSYNLK